MQSRCSPETWPSLQAGQACMYAKNTVWVLGSCSSCAWHPNKHSAIHSVRHGCVTSAMMMMACLASTQTHPAGWPCQVREETRKLCAAAEA